MTAFRGESSVLGAYLDEVHRVLSESGRLDQCTLVMVDDMSLDDSVDVVKSGQERHPDMEIHVLSPPTNLGTQGAIAWGLSQIELSDPKSQWVFSMDADGEDDITALPKMMDMAKARPDTVIYSVRTSRQDSMRMKLLYFPFRHLYKHMTGQKILPNNFMVLPGRYQRAVLHSPFLPVYYALATLKLKLPWLPSPSGRRLRYAGHSTQNLFNLVTHALVGLMIFHETVMARIYSYIGFAFLILISTNFFALFVKYAQNKGVPDGYMSTFLTMNFGFGVVLLSMLGFTAGTSMVLKLASYYLIRWNTMMEKMASNWEA